MSIYNSLCLQKRCSGVAGRKPAAWRQRRQAGPRRARALPAVPSQGRASPAVPALLQVELNTIASSFGCLSTLVARMHAYLLGRLGASEAELAALPTHNAMDSIADAMGAAVAEYCAVAGSGAGEAVMVMVVQPGERNAYDQQWLQTRLWERHGVRTLRRSLAQVCALGEGSAPAVRRMPPVFMLTHGCGVARPNAVSPPPPPPALPARSPPFSALPIPRPLLPPCQPAACGRGAAGAGRVSHSGRPPRGARLLPSRHVTVGLAWQGWH